MFGVSEGRVGRCFRVVLVIAIEKEERRRRADFRVFVCGMGTSLVLRSFARFVVFEFVFVRRFSRAFFVFVYVVGIGAAEEGVVFGGE